MTRAWFAIIAFALSSLVAGYAQVPPAGVPATSGQAQSQPRHAKKSTPAAHPSAPAANPGDDLNKQFLDQANADWRAADENGGVQQASAAETRNAQAWNDYLIWALDQDRAIYRWHHISSIIIFFVVIFLVLSGVWFSWMQFRHAHRLPSQDITASVTSATTQAPVAPVAPVIATEEKDSVTEFSASPQGIKVASSAIGVIILVISMCFFYLYLDKVYPITLIPAGQSGPSHSSTPR